MKPHLLIVDDDREIRTQMRWALTGDFHVFQAGDRPEAMELFSETHPPVVLLDLGLPPHPNSPEEGLEVLSEMLQRDPFVKIVIVSGQGEKENTLKAVGAGAYDFLSKPVDIDELKQLLKRCFHVALLEREYHEMKEQLQGDFFEGMLGSSPSIRAVFDSIRKVSATEASVLILGESGTGKELAARAIHLRSSYKDGPFVPINCSAIPESLLESELFGHEKGAFTGAHTQRKGRIEQAIGGTLFLDEIGEIPLSVQVKLLRFLQEQCIERVGGREEIKVNTRVIAATNVDLQRGMTDGSFREGLYYRLAVVELVLPPLREREGDIELLAKSLLQGIANENGKPGLAFDKKALSGIKRYAWPGNIRELQNRIKRAVIMSEGKRLSLEDLELPPTFAPSGLSLKDARESLERKMIQQALQKSSGKIAPAATALGISRPTFYELMKKLGIESHKSIE
ncbi:MAG: PEP-CTERM-box response regulator transcription factor [Opitutaceae bacterium]|nr:PEP-CTERM-box response regulator transcription factor [Opitutaceae bacterium]